MTIIDNAVYVDGLRTADPESLDETYFLLRQREGMAWIGLYRPDADELRVRGRGVRPQRPGRGGRARRPPARQTGALRRMRVPGAAAGPVPGRRGEGGVRRDPRVCRAPSTWSRSGTRSHRTWPRSGGGWRHAGVPRPGPEAVLYGILDQVVDEYEPVAAGLENDIDEIEDDLFGADPDVSRRIYELSRQVITFQRATGPLVGILQALISGTRTVRPDRELQDHLRDVAGPRAAAQRAGGVLPGPAAERAGGQRRPRGAAAERRDARLTESSFAQSEQVKRISSWAAILFAPTLVGTIYGMNFRLHARAELGVRLPLCPGPDGGHGAGAVLDVQAQQVDLAPAPGAPPVQ